MSEYEYEYEYENEYEYDYEQLKYSCLRYGKLSWWSPK